MRRFNLLRVVLIQQRLDFEFGGVELRAAPFHEVLPLFEEAQRVFERETAAFQLADDLRERGVCLLERWVFGCRGQGKILSLTVARSSPLPSVIVMPVPGAASFASVMRLPSPARVTIA